MLYLMFFVLGFIICLVFTRKPLQIHIKHTTENITNELSSTELQQLEKEMNKKDPKEDDEFSGAQEIIQDITEIMGGSDR